MRNRGKVFFFQIVSIIAVAHIGLWAQKPAVKPDAAITATPAASPKTSRTPVQTVEELRSKIRGRMLSPEAARGRVGIKITSLSSGRVVFENDAEKYFIPASNMKNFTVAAALEKLGPDFRFVTSVFAAGKPDASGTIKGDLRIFGRGDISISTAFNNGDYYKGIDNLVEKIVAAGVKRIEGDLVGDESYFNGNPVPYTWEWDDLQWYDGAEISALPVNNNAVDLSVKPPLSSGGACVVTVSPSTAMMVIVNTCTSSQAGQGRTLKVFKPLGRNALEISGTMPLGDKGFTGYIAFTHPAEMFMEMLKQRLLSKNIVVSGKTRFVSSPVTSDKPPVEITRLESPPLSSIAAQTMKPSQNMFTETILWTLGEKARERATYFDNIDVFAPRKDSSQWGLDWVKTFLNEIGIPRDSVLMYDGSGMSRHNQVTTASLVMLYTYMAKQSKHAQIWRDSLTVGGVDGTLRRRFAGTTAEGNLRGKTGTLDQVSALSGYVTTAGGDQLVVSVIVNGVAETRTRTALIDDIVVSLANFNGKVDQSEPPSGQQY